MTDRDLLLTACPPFNTRLECGPVDKYIGESACVVREMFGYAREHEPCVIFMDEVDAIGGRQFLGRFQRGTRNSANTHGGTFLAGNARLPCLWHMLTMCGVAAEQDGRLRLTRED